MVSLSLFLVFFLMASLCVLLTDFQKEFNCLHMKIK